MIIARYGIIIFLSVSYSFSQTDSLQEYAKVLDSLKLKVSRVIITGNEVTRDEVILREMKLVPGALLTMHNYLRDFRKLYNLRLFNRVDIIPIPENNKRVIINVNVNERWYIFPLPDAGMENGEWKKVWLSLGILWDNMRGMNESLFAGFRVFYNPWIKFKYEIPWIGRRLKLFSSFEASWSRNRNKSIELSGASSNEINYNNQGYDNTIYRISLKLGKKFSDDISVYTESRFNLMRVSEYKSGRTMSPDGRDIWLSLGLGFSYDSRNFFDYTTKGYYINTSYYRSGFGDVEVNFGRFNIESRMYLPVYLTGKYFLTFASKFYNSLAIGPQIPAYQREFLGYSDHFVRGWSKFAFEGDNSLTLYNELRIPVISPKYLRGRDLPLIRDILIAKDLDYRYGLYLSLIYDLGTVWMKSESIFRKKFMQGAGMGINFLAPFNYVLRLDWVFRLGRPVVGEIGVALRAKF
ncbi:MAG: hypothetical protein N2510_02450 [Ignavibacteria bacterium]|nr:hypothetical protein [Ignavibacteria bacterium]